MALWSRRNACRFFFWVVGCWKAINWEVYCLATSVLRSAAFVSRLSLAGNCVRVSRRFRLAHEIQAKGLGLKILSANNWTVLCCEGKAGQAVNMNYSGLSVPAPVISHVNTRLVSGHVTINWPTWSYLRHTLNIPRRHFGELSVLVLIIRLDSRFFLIPRPH